MKKPNNKLKLYALLATLVLATTSFSILLPVSAHDPAWEIPTFAYVNAAPGTVGVNQPVLIVVFLDKTIAGTHISNDIRFYDYELTIIKPDGSTDVVNWPVVTDTTSSAFTQYIPNQVGTYTLEFNYPGQVYDFGGEYDGDYYLPSNATTTLTVQEEAISIISDTPLPAEYWTRPIEGQNVGWAKIASNYLDPFREGYSFGSSRYQPDGAAPNSPHVLWTKPIQFGGVVGGTTVGVEGATYYTGLSYQPKFITPIIIYGRLYYGLPESDSTGGTGFFGGPGGGYVCVDLKTGEQLWWQNYTVNPSFAQLVMFDSPNQHGVIPNGYLWAVSGSTWTAYDPLDGSWVFEITDVPSGTRAYGPNGEVVIYQMDVENNWLALWNVTNVITNGPEGSIDFTQGYRPVGKIFNSTERLAYSWNVTIPELPSDATIRYTLYDDMLVASSGTGGSTQFGGIPSVPSVTFWAIDLDDNSRGDLVWTETYDAPANNVTRQIGPVDSVNRIFCMSDKETMKWLGFDLDTGAQLWGPVGDARGFNYYPTVGSGGNSQVGFTAYGKLYSGGYGGEIFCFDTSNGDLVWKYSDTDSGLQTPYGLTPIFPGAIADDKIYVYSNEHSPNSPMYKGFKARCLNATTGEELWTLLSWAGVGAFADEGWPVADGIITYLNAYDMQIYAIGKGPSATTVSASPKVTELGKSIIIEGTVIDTSAGTAQAEQDARFPYGVPAVSDASMSEWMEYIYMQKARPSNTIGVDVKLSIIDPNMNYHELTATSDSLGVYSLMWEAPVPGKYTVIATFEGSESYYQSQAETTFGIDEATAASIPIETEEPEPEVPEQPTEPVETPLIATEIALAIVVAVAIVAVIYLVLRRQK
ncbi:MAG: PQQ-binding-like beta-propeller repeat protein [archaeon]